jgi:hypothetical protein
MFRIDKPVNLHIKVENNILKELAIFDAETRDNNATNSTFEEVSDEREIMGNSTKNHTEIEINSTINGNDSNNAINSTTKKEISKNSSSENSTSSKVEEKRSSSNIKNLTDIAAERSMQIDMKNRFGLNATNEEGIN